MTHLAKVPARRIIGAISDAAERWTDADFPPRVRLLDSIVERTGYALPTVEFALDELFGALTVEQLTGVIANELGSVEALDGEYAAAGRVCVISSRTTIGVAIVPAVFALCAKCDVVVKDREDGLVRAFFASLAAEMTEMQGAAIASVWDGEHDAVSLDTFDVVVAFGADATMARISRRISAQTTFIEYGSKASIGYITRDALTSEESALFIARGAARDLVLYETQGCLSLHHLFIEPGGEITPERFAEMLAREVQRAAIEFPLGDRNAASIAGVANERNVAAFRAASGRGAVFSDDAASFLIIVDQPATEPPLFLPRALAISIVERPAQAVSYLVEHGISIEAIAVAPQQPIRDLSVLSSRFVAFGEMQHPGIGGTHGGRQRIAEFVHPVMIRP